MRDLTTVVPSAFVTKAVLTRTASLAIRLPLSRRLASMMCWHDFTSFSRRRRLWGIVTCLVLPRRNVLVLTLTLSLVGLRIKHLYITYFSSVTSSRNARLISIVAPLTYRISLPMSAFVPARRCTYASNPFNLPWVILTFCPFFKGPV